jgi:hypothetical protein
MRRVLILGTCGCEMGHGQQRAVGRGVGMMWDVHAAERPSAAVGVTVGATVGAYVVPIYDVAVGEDVGEHALVTELAIALRTLAPTDWFGCKCCVYL